MLMVLPNVVCWPLNFMLFVSSFAYFGIVNLNVAPWQGARRNLARSESPTNEPAHRREDCVRAV